MRLLNDAKTTLELTILLPVWEEKSFCILLPYTNLEQANKVAERLRQKTEAIPIISDGTRVKVTISVGISLVSEGDNDGHDAIDRADKNFLKRNRQEETEYVHSFTTKL